MTGRPTLGRDGRAVEARRAAAVPRQAEASGPGARVAPVSEHAALRRVEELILAHGFAVGYDRRDGGIWLAHGGSLGPAFGLDPPVGYGGTRLESAISLLGRLPRPARDEEARAAGFEPATSGSGG